MFRFKKIHSNFIVRRSATSTDILNNNLTNIHTRAGIHNNTIYAQQIPFHFLFNKLSVNDFQNLKKKITLKIINYARIATKRKDTLTMQPFSKIDKAGMHFTTNSK